MDASSRTDLLIVGGGLAGGLIALAVHQRRPELSVTIVEREATLGGNHIWSFFDSDIAPGDRALVEPLICHRWHGHDVAFPKLKRTLRGNYNSIESERLDAAVRAALPVDSVHTGRGAIEIEPDGVRLADGKWIAAKGVIDARGLADRTALDLGWQKFVGRLLRLNQPHGLERPVIMDATVDQMPGYRFVYLLPFDSHRVFVEDTYYSETPEIDAARIGDRILDYAYARGWSIAEIEREEAAALPIACGGDFDRLWPAGAGVARAGMGAGLFQPMTGYSLPDAVRTAAMVAALPFPSSPVLAEVLRQHARAAWDDRAFYRLLARMLFRAADPSERYRLLERFYRLGEGLIARFYAGRSTFPDKARILIGRPPVPLRRALAVIRESGWQS